MGRRAVWHRAECAAMAAGAALVGLALSGCVVAPGPPYYTGQMVAVAPSPREPAYAAPGKNGYDWVGGYWVWVGGRHEWVPGHWQPR